MKALLLLSAPVSTFGATPLGCVDFSGRYVTQGEDGRVYPVIAQVLCSRISFSWESTIEPNDPPLVHNLTLDGTFQADKGWLGDNVMSFISARIQANTLLIHSRSLQDPKDAPRLQVRIERLSDGDLCISDEHTDAISPAARAARIRGHGSHAEETAAERSSRGCEAP